ncbi:hypothetical protein AB0F52_07295 [Amycolatopsis sp. NPDC024027]|uniref:hypothetical protein n=1 Tax=Amycolatopsis sp. NPDC024027 TaxID=3154327 RepID=UPI0033F36754
MRSKMLTAGLVLALTTALGGWPWPTRVLGDDRRWRIRTRVPDSRASRARP